MKLLYRGLIVALIQCLIVLSLAGKYAIDRERLPRVWVKTAPIDPNLPVRGRYVRLRLEVNMAGSPVGTWTPVRLSVEDGRLVATPASSQSHVHATGTLDRSWTIAQPVAFFIPEHVRDPSARAVGEELWVEVSVPNEAPFAQFASE